MEEKQDYINKLENQIVVQKDEINKLRNYLNEIYDKNSFLINKLVHNLKNSIGVMYSFSEMMNENTEEYTSEKLIKYATVIHDSANYSIKTLNSIAEISELQSPDFKFDTAKVNYIKIVNEVIESLENEIQSRKIDIICNFKENEVFLDLDKEKISQVIYNLLHNAIRFSKDNSTIIIEITETKNRVETRIIDQGIGIPDKDVLNVTNEFFKVNTYDPLKTKCIGLGLSITKIIILGHKGQLTITSKENSGTTISLLLFKEIY